MRTSVAPNCSRRIFFCAAWVAAALAYAGELSAEEQIDFVRDIQPILSAHCYECHADTEVEGGIRWDQKSALLGGDSGEVTVVPGKPGKARYWPTCVAREMNGCLPKVQESH